MNYMCEPPLPAPNEETEWRCPDCGSLFVSRQDGPVWDWLYWDWQ